MLNKFRKFLKLVKNTDIPVSKKMLEYGTYPWCFIFWLPFFVMGICNLPFITPVMVALLIIQLSCSFIFIAKYLWVDPAEQRRNDSSLEMKNWIDPNNH